MCVYIHVFAFVCVCVSVCVSIHPSLPSRMYRKLESRTTETKKQSPNTGARANNTLHK